MPQDTCQLQKSWIACQSDLESIIAVNSEQHSTVLLLVSDRKIMSSELATMVAIFLNNPTDFFVVRMDTATGTLQDIRQEATRQGENIANCLFTTPEGEVIAQSIEHLLQYQHILHGPVNSFLRMERENPKDIPTPSSTTSDRESHPPLANTSESHPPITSNSSESSPPSTSVQSPYFTCQNRNGHHREGAIMSGNPPSSNSGNTGPPPELYPIFTKNRKWTCTSSASKFHVYSEEDIASSATDKERQYKQFWNNVGQEEAVQGMTKAQMQEEVHDHWRTVKAKAAEPTPTTMTSTTVVTNTTCTSTSTTTVTVTTTVTTVTTTPLLDQLPGLRAQLVTGKDHYVERNLQRYFDNPQELDKVAEVIRRRYVKKGVNAGFVKHHVLKLTVS
ncbi:uncharacterized protein LOC144924637 isoform X1 [Branchiostoma floridae x Branchiostoma belcheri]